MPTNLVIPENSEDLMEFLNSPEKVKSVGNGPTEWGPFIQEYAQKFSQADRGVLEEQRKAQLSAEVTKLLEENGYVKEKGHRGRVPMSEEGTKAKGWSAFNSSTVMRQAHIFNPEAVGAYPEADFKHFGEWLQKAAIYLKDNVKDAMIKDMSESIFGDGGALVPEEFRAELLRLSLEAAVVRPRARVIPMGSAVLRFPAIHVTSHASNLFGGIVGNWKAEAASVSSAINQPTFRQIRLEPYKLTAYTVASNELLADSAIAMEALIGQLFPEALAYFEDDAFINGTGAGQPLGIINADALLAITAEGGQSATTLVYENLIKMYARMLPQSLQSAVWVAHPDVLPQLATMSLTVGTGGGPLWIMNATQSVPMSIFGRPIIFTEKCQTLGTAGDIFFVDFGHYLIGDRQALTMARSEHVNFNTDEMAWRFTQRVDGRPWLTSAITPRNGSNSFSPYINLATRS